MTRFLPDIFLDYSSFFAGLLLAAILIFLVVRYRGRVSALFSKLRSETTKLKIQLAAESESDYMQVLLNYAQSLHISAHLQPLNAVKIPPRCIAPPPEIYPGGENLDPSLIQQTLGHDPYLPELAAEYHAPTISLSEAVKTRAHICLTGFPGSGKTTAIADCICGLLSSPQEGTRIPFYTKAHHILSQFPGRDMLAIILAAIQTNPLFRTIPGFPKFLTNAINSDQAILFIDDLDLLNYSDTNRLANFINALTRNIPGLQLVTTASPACLGSLVSTPLAMVSIAPWSDAEKLAFLKKWDKPRPGAQNGEDGLVSESSGVANSLLVVSDDFSSPLEFTLKAWAASAGDIRGPSALQNLDTHLRRCFPSNTEEYLHALETIALHTLEQEKSSFTRKDVSSWYVEVTSDTEAGLDDEKISPLAPALQIAHENGLIERDGADGFYFANSTLAGVLAARGLSRASAQVLGRILTQPDWSLKREAMRFLPGFVDIRPYLPAIKADRSLFKEQMIGACSWLSGLRNQPEAETDLLKTITREIHANPVYLVKLRLAVSLAKTGNPNCKSIFQHFLKSPEAETRRAAALASGLIKDLSAVPLLITLLNDPFPVSAAACYALGRIGSPHSLEAIAECLLRGNELLRRAAAEALAHNRSEGHPALREGATRDDLLVRYAVVHGLGQIPESWALEILDHMRIQEKEWIVRDLAQQVYEVHEKGSPYLPHNGTPSHLAPWLHAYAEKQDLPAITPETALEALLHALKAGSDEQKQASLNHLRSEAQPEILPSLAALYQHSSPVIRQLAVLTAWYCLPPHYSPPTQSPQ